MRIIDTWRDPYDEGWSVCNRKQIEFKPGLTVLVGCNGIGKTTTLENIKEQLKEEKVPCVMFDQLNEDVAGDALWNQDYSLAANAMASSEGEKIGLAVKQFSTKLRDFIYNGRYSRGHDLAYIIHKEEIDKEVREILRPQKERWILIDAIDSGYSIDNTVEIKELFDTIIKDTTDNFDKEVYLIVSANAYELARNEQCMDVTTGKYITFKDYEDYRRFILKTRQKKEKRYK